jgi:hypothetical protein
MVPQTSIAVLQPLSTLPQFLLAGHAVIGVHVVAHVPLAQTIVTGHTPQTRLAPQPSGAVPHVAVPHAAAVVLGVHVASGGGVITTSGTGGAASGVLDRPPVPGEASRLASAVPPDPVGVASRRASGPVGGRASLKAASMDAPPTAVPPVEASRTPPPEPPVGAPPTAVPPCALFPPCEVELDAPPVFPAPPLPPAALPTEPPPSPAGPAAPSSESSIESSGTRHAPIDAKRATPRRNRRTVFNGKKDSLRVSPSLTASMRPRIEGPHPLLSCSSGG